MSYIFISHASEDKIERVRPIVEVLLAEGEPVWIDRPGVGAGNLGFNQQFIARHGIDYLHSGRPWSDGLQNALRHSGAVLGCLSRALIGQRDVIIGELTVASAMGKLVTCIVDDLEFDELPKLTMGMLEAGPLQALKVKPQLLRRAIDERQARDCTVEELPEELIAEWERVRNIVGNINRIRAEPRRMGSQDLQSLVPRLRRMPIPPVLKFTSIPEEIIFALGEHVTEPKRIQALLQQANELTKAAEPDQELARKLVIREGALIPIGSTSSDNFWTKVFQHAGLIARRTVASILLTPVAAWAMQQAEIEETAERFLDALETGTLE